MDVQPANSEAAVILKKLDPEVTELWFLLHATSFLYSSSKGGNGMKNS